MLKGIREVVGKWLRNINALSVDIFMIRKRETLIRELPQERRLKSFHPIGPARSAVPQKRISKRCEALAGSKGRLKGRNHAVEFLKDEYQYEYQHEYLYEC